MYKKVTLRIHRTPRIIRDDVLLRMLGISCSGYSIDFGKEVRVVSWIMALAHVTVTYATRRRREFVRYTLGCTTKSIANKPNFSNPNLTIDF